MTDFDKYLQAFQSGVVATDLTTDQNPHPNNEHRQLGWWHGKQLAEVLGCQPQLLVLITNHRARYWQAHAQGMAAHRLGGNLLANPYAPKGWDSFQCPEYGDKVSWSGWGAGWRYGSLLNNFQPGKK